MGLLMRPYTLTQTVQNAVKSSCRRRQLQRLFGDDLLEIACAALHLVAGGRPRRIAGKPLLAGFQELLRPVVIQALSDAFAAAQRGDRLLTA
jgi:hypothetical protein